MSEPTHSGEDPGLVLAEQDAQIAEREDAAGADMEAAVRQGGTWNVTPRFDDLTHETCLHRAAMLLIQAEQHFNVPSIAEQHRLNADAWRVLAGTVRALEREVPNAPAQ